MTKTEWAIVRAAMQWHKAWIDSGRIIPFMLYTRMSKACAAHAKAKKRKVKR